MALSYVVESYKKNKTNNKMLITRTLTIDENNTKILHWSRTAEITKTIAKSSYIRQSLAWYHVFSIVQANRI